MASSTTIDVDDFGNDIKGDGMESLDFQDIPHSALDSPEKGQTTHFTRFPHSAADSDDEADDKEKLIKEEKSGTSSFWTFTYYQQFFDVETAQVGQRIVGSMVPKPGSNYLVHHIRPNPDLYGPFWICTTLVFTTAIAGNLANYFSMAGKSYHWQYDFHKVTFAATAIFSYWWLVPLLLWAVLWWRGSQAKFSFLEMLCVYGYSLAIYVPISILWAIQVSWLQWTLVVVGAALSGSVLLLTFWPAIKEDSQKIAIGLMVFIFIMHAALAAGFVLYFFHVPASAPATKPIAPLPVPINDTARPKAFAPVNAAAKSGQAPVENGDGDISISSQNQLRLQQNSAGAIPQAKSPAQAAVAPVNEGHNLINGGQAQNPGQALTQGLNGILSKKTENAQGGYLLQNRNSLGGQQQQQPVANIEPEKDVAGQMGLPQQTNKEQALPRNPQQPGGFQRRRSLTGKRGSNEKILGRAVLA